jgi:hypothetical protein
MREVKRLRDTGTRHPQHQNPVLSVAVEGVQSWTAWFGPQQNEPSEQARVLRLLVLRVDYDGKNGKASITFQPLGLKTLAREMFGRPKEEHCA